MPTVYDCCIHDITEPYTKTAMMAVDGDGLHSPFSILPRGGPALSL